MPITRFKDKEEKEEYLKQLKENRNETIKLAQQEQVRANKLFNENNKISFEKTMFICVD